MSLTPAQHTLAYRVWAHCHPSGWDCTIGECAKELGVHSNAVRAIAGLKGWSNRFRVAARGAYFEIAASVKGTRLDEVSEMSRMMEAAE